MPEPTDHDREIARALLRELNDAMASPRGDYYQGDVRDPHRALHIVERHVIAALARAREEEREACAQIADKAWAYTIVADDIAAAIRQRSAPPGGESHA